MKSNQRILIEKDIILNKWIVWAYVSLNSRIELYRSTTKKDCKRWIKENE